MKTIGQLKIRAAAILLLLVQLALVVTAGAQESGQKVVDEIGDKKQPTEWYQATWVWVVSIMVFTIIVISMISVNNYAKKK